MENFITKVINARLNQDIYSKFINIDDIVGKIK